MTSDPDHDPQSAEDMDLADEDSSEQPEAEHTMVLDSVEIPGPPEEEAAEDDEMDFDADGPEVERTMVLDAVEIPPPAEASDEDGSEDAADEDGFADEDEADDAVFDISELARSDDEDDDDFAAADDDAAAEEGDEFGGPEDASAEQPIVFGDSEESAALAATHERDALEVVADEASDEAPAPKRERETPLRGAYEYLTIRTPIAEFESYARARTEALVRLGETEEAEVAALAMRLGVDALRRVMGGLPKETP